MAVSPTCSLDDARSADYCYICYKATSGAVAARLGSTTRDFSYLRDRLLKKGTLVASGGELTFPVPGMAAWVAGRS